MTRDDNINSKNELREILSDYKEKRKEADALKKNLSAKTLRDNRVKSVSRIIISIAAIAALLVVSYGAVNESGILKKRTYWALGQKFDSDYKLEECIGVLWQVRAAIDNYYAERRTFPLDLAEIYKDKKGSIHYACPVSEEPYIIKDLDGHNVYCCPNPAKHGVAELWCDVRGGPPTIERN